MTCRCGSDSTVCTCQTPSTDAVTEGNALCQAIRERDVLRKRNEELANRVGELTKQRDDSSRRLELAEEDVTELRKALLNLKVPTLRDQVSMHVLQGLLAHNGEDDSRSAVSEALRYADAFLEERSR